MPTSAAVALATPHFADELAPARADTPPHAWRDFL